MSPALRFWGSAAGAAVVFAGLVPVLMPYRALGLDPAVERDFVWLLTVFCAGVMLVLFGVSAWVGGRRSIGLRDVIDAGGVQRALDRAAAKGRAQEGRYTENAAAWCVAAGALLLLIYSVLYGVLV